MNCQKRDCHFEAQWYPVFLIYPDRARHPEVPPIQSMAGVALCNACRATVTPEDLLTEEGWRMIEDIYRMFSRGLEAHRASTEMTFVSIVEFPGTPMMRNTSL
jgi:hypothetical protein